MPVTKTPEYENKMLGARIPFEAINEAGTYLSNWTGHLIRVPEDGFKLGRSPLIEIKGKSLSSSRIG